MTPVLHAGTPENGEEEWLKQDDDLERRPELETCAACRRLFALSRAALLRGLPRHGAAAEGRLTPRCLPARIDTTLGARTSDYLINRLVFF